MDQRLIEGSCPWSETTSGRRRRATSPVTVRPRGGRARLLASICGRYVVNAGVHGLAELARGPDHLVGTGGGSADPQAGVASGQDALGEWVKHLLVGIRVAVFLGSIDERQGKPLTHDRQVA